MSEYIDDRCINNVAQASGIVFWRISHLCYFSHLEFVDAKGSLNKAKMF